MPRELIGALGGDRRALRVESSCCLDEADGRARDRVLDGARELDGVAAEEQFEVRSLARDASYLGEERDALVGPSRAVEQKVTSVLRTLAACACSRRVREEVRVCAER